MSRHQTALQLVGTEAGARLSDFELFWECYPRKKSKLDAERAWAQTAATRPPIEKVLATLDMLWREDWQFREKTYLPYPASWIRAGGWADED